MTAVDWDPNEDYDPDYNPDTDPWVWRPAVTVELPPVDDEAVRYSTGGGS